MEKIIAIVMERDEMSREEATEVVKEARKAILEAAANDDYGEAEEITARVAYGQTLDSAMQSLVTV